MSLRYRRPACRERAERCRSRDAEHSEFRPVVRLSGCSPGEGSAISSRSFNCVSRDFGHCQQCCPMSDGRRQAQPRLGAPGGLTTSVGPAGHCRVRYLARPAGAHRRAVPSFVQRATLPRAPVPGRGLGFKPLPR